MRLSDLTGKHIGGTFLGATALIATLTAIYIGHKYPERLSDANYAENARTHYTAQNLLEAEGNDVMMETCGPECYEITIGEFNAVRGAYEGPMIHSYCENSRTTIKTDAKAGSKLEKLANPVAVREIRDAVLRKHKGVKL